MAKVLVTGMSGTGKSSVLRELSRRGFQVVDTDTDAWSEWVVLPDGSRDWIWAEPKMTASCPAMPAAISSSQAAALIKASSLQPSMRSCC